MVRDIKAGALDVVLAYSLSRLTRQVRQFLDLIDLHTRYGVLFKTCVSGDPDLSTADGRGLAISLANWDQMESERTSERLRRAYDQKARDGRYHGPRPFGYDAAVDAQGNKLTGRDASLVIREDEAAVLRECARRVLAGEALWSITKDLRSRGVRTTRGNPWQTQPLRQALINPLYVSKRVHRPMINGKRSSQKREYDGNWPAIFTDEIHDRLVAMLTDPGRRSSDSTSVQYLMTGIAYCGECGGRLVGTKEYTYLVKAPTKSDPDNKRLRTFPPTYSCHQQGCHRVGRRMDKVDELVEGVIVRLLELNGVEVFGGDSGALAEAEERIAEIKAKLDLISDMLIDNEITKEQFDRQNRRLRDKLAGEEARRRKAAPDVTMASLIGVSAAQTWPTLSLERKRKVIRLLEDAVGLRVTIDYIGPGVMTDPDVDPYIGIRIESRMTD